MLIFRHLNHMIFIEPLLDSMFLYTYCTYFIEFNKAAILVCLDMILNGNLRRICFFSPIYMVVIIILKVVQMESFLKIRLKYFSEKTFLPFRKSRAVSNQT